MQKWYGIRICEYIDTKPDRYGDPGPCLHAFVEIAGEPSSFLVHFSESGLTLRRK